RGSLTLYLAGEAEFTREHARILAVVGPKLATALANGMRFQELKGRAGADPLTGLPNAAALAARLSALRESCAVVVCDLDGFKDINDHFGHLVGNRVLESLAGGFRGSCRSQDFVARLGGDEFVLLLAGVQKEEIGSRLEDFRAMVRSVGRAVSGTDK